MSVVHHCPTGAIPILGKKHYGGDCEGTKDNGLTVGAGSPRPSPQGAATAPLHLIITVILLIHAASSLVAASEVLEETNTQVVVREHPRTGKPYVSIIRSDGAAKDPFAGQGKFYSRPDYRMLDPKVKSGAIPYNGPYSNKTKIYIFAASLATLGAASGAAVIAAAPAATGAAASGGAGAYLAAGTAVVAGSAAAADIAMKPDLKKGDYTLGSESRLLKEEEDRKTKGGNHVD